MTQRVLHQFTEIALVGDAISDQVFLIRKWLRDLGFESHIYTLHADKALENEVRLASNYYPTANETHVIYHHAVGADIVPLVLGSNLRIILIYHNITPPEFISYISASFAKQLTRGREQLHQLLPQADLVLGDSAYNEQELAGRHNAISGVLPIVLDPNRYNTPSNPQLVQDLSHTSPNLLFVGRLFPNKRQEDLIKLLYFLRRIHPNAKLHLVGSEASTAYTRWLRELLTIFDLDNAVNITGHVSFQDMVTYFRTADFYVSMSEHEGFGKPLIESMYFGLPILAYASSAVPDTLGKTGILFHQKSFEAIAELCDWLLDNPDLYETLIAQQRQRLQAFLEPNVKIQWVAYLKQLNLLP